MTGQPLPSCAEHVAVAIGRSLEGSYSRFLLVRRSPPGRKCQACRAPATFEIRELGRYRDRRGPP